MPTIQELAMAGSLKVPDKDTHTSEGMHLNMKACIDEIFDLYVVDKSKWAAVCREHGSNRLYALQHNIHVPDIGMTTMAVTDYRRERARDLGKIVIKASKEEWENEYERARKVIETFVKDMEISHIRPIQFDADINRMRGRGRQRVSAYADAGMNTRLFLSMESIPDMWHMNGKPSYKFLAFYDYPWDSNYMRVLYDEDRLHTNILGLVADPSPGEFTVSDNGITLKLPAVFREALWILFNRKMQESVKAYKPGWDINVEAVLRSGHSVVYVGNFKGDRFLWSINSSAGCHVYPMERNNQAYTTVDRIITDKEIKDPRAVKWLCSDEVKENILSDLVILRLGGD